MAGICLCLILPCTVELDSTGPLLTWLNHAQSRPVVRGEGDVSFNILQPFFHELTTCGSLRKCFAPVQSESITSLPALSAATVVGAIGVDLQAMVFYSMTSCAGLATPRMPGALQQARGGKLCLTLLTPLRRYHVTDASVHLLERTGDFAGVLQWMPKCIPCIEM